MDTTNEVQAQSTTRLVNIAASAARLVLLVNARRHHVSEDIRDGASALQADLERAGLMARSVKGAS